MVKCMSSEAKGIHLHFGSLDASSWLLPDTQKDDSCYLAQGVLAGKDAPKCEAGKGNSRHCKNSLHSTTEVEILVAPFHSIC